MRKTFVFSLVSVLALLLCPVCSLSAKACPSPALVTPIEVENIPGLHLVFVSSSVLQQDMNASVESVQDVSSTSGNAQQPQIDVRVQAQLLALEILAQAYQEYLSDRIGGFDDIQAKARLVGTLQAVGFESESAGAVLRNLEENQALYPVPEEIKHALQQISQSR